VAKIRTPILLINNLYDNIMPEVDAFNTSAGLEGGVVLRQNSSEEALFLSLFIPIAIPREINTHTTRSKAHP
jgi:hypothetical protein